MSNTLLNFFGLGRYRFSGSIASLLATLFFAIPNLAGSPQIMLWHLVLFVVLLIWSIILLERGKQAVEESPSEVVVDEFLGLYICLILADPFSMGDVLFLFLIFRSLDLLKIPPFSWLEKKLPVHRGVLAGDLFIGIVVGMVWYIMTKPMIL